jgi:hypothetical protein
VELGVEVVDGEPDEDSVLDAEGVGVLEGDEVGVGVLD